MLKSASYCPASISLIFKACPSRDLLKTGSVGVGFTVDKGVTAETEKAKETEIIFNGQKINFPTVASITDALSPHPVKVRITSDLPLGFGFGISAASSLSAAWSLNHFLGLKKTNEELARIAHIAEIKNKTGLGSVGTQITGGFLVKTKPGLHFKATVLPLTGLKIYATVIERLTTPTVLSDRKKLSKINKIAQKAIKNILASSFTLEEIFDISYRFACDSLLVNHPITSSLIKQIRAKGNHATMTMLGQVVLSTVKPDNIKGYKTIPLIITKDTIHYI
jgi:pantoate kinase